jgi:predicted DNA-binding transcriptional regulator YafY
MNRIERISAILIQLQSKKVVKGQEIADRFSISLRTAYRDIRALEQSGVPISSEAGIGYSLVEGYRLPPISFTQDEATAFLTADKLVEKFTDKTTASQYQSALFKIKAVLKNDEKDRVENLEENIDIVNEYDISIIEKPSDHIQTILSSISDKTALHLDYFALHSQEETTRNVEPIGIFLMGSNWYLIAFCLLRNDYRNFRLDRINKSIQTRLPFSQKHPSLKKYLKEFIKTKQGIHSIRIKVENSCLKYLGEQKYYHGFIKEKRHANHTEMIFLSSSLEGFARWFIMFGDLATISEPKELKLCVKQIATSILKKLEKQ